MRFPQDVPAIFCCHAFLKQALQYGVVVSMDSHLLDRPSQEARWLPQRGGKYFAILGDGTIQHFHWHSTAFDHDAWQFGNCFSTWEEAKHTQQALHAVLLHMHQPMRNYCAKHQQYYATFCVYCGPPVRLVDGGFCEATPQRAGHTPAAQAHPGNGR